MGLILLRYGELGLKGENRVEFVRRLRRNVRACLKAQGVPGEVFSLGQRVYVRTERVNEVLEPLSRVFGLVSLSPVAEVPRDMQAISEACVQLARDAGVGPGVSYRVQARRVDKSFPFISPEIKRLAGEAINLALGGKVDLSDQADVTIGIEVSYQNALVFGRVIPAPGGLPLGSEGRVVALISGGIDSPVAAWMMMKRGCGVIPVHFTHDKDETQKALDNIAVLGRYSYGWTLHPVILDHNEVVGPTLRRLRELREERWSCIFCKRALLLRACQVADEKGAKAIVMGDALGQVASQTLANMAAITYGIPKLVLRPLVGMDKAEIVALARRIGTFEISTRSEGHCPFLPTNPLTRAGLDKLQEIAERLAEMEAKES